MSGIMRYSGGSFYKPVKGVGDALDLSALDASIGSNVSDMIAADLPEFSYGSSLNIPGLIQTGVQDAFQFVKLLDPVPAGTTLQVGKDGSYYVSRAQPGVPTAQLLPPGGMSGWGTLALLGGGALLLFAMARGRG